MQNSLNKISYFTELLYDVIGSVFPANSVFRRLEPRFRKISGFVFVKMCLVGIIITLCRVSGGDVTCRAGLFL